MGDIKFIRALPNEFDEGLKKRGMLPQSSEVLELDSLLLMKKQELQMMQARRNEIAKEIGIYKANGHENEIKILMTESEEIKNKMYGLEEFVNAIQKRLEDVLALIPNTPDISVPIGIDEQDNVVIKHHKAPQEVSFNPKQHFEIGERLHQMDFSSAAKISGSRFVVLKNELAQLERALINFMIDTHTLEYGYIEYSVPTLVTEETMFGVGQLPKFAEDSFVTTCGKRLIPTSEVPLTGLFSNTILQETELPIRLVSSTDCYRSEAGSAGRDTRGMIRLHQFKKVELVSITRPQDSDKEHERMLQAAESILQKLDIPYRIVLLCTGDMGFTSQKTYDIEVWLPGQDKYREISSCSNCGSFQALRMNGRYKDCVTGKNKSFHTLNGSALAVGRTLVAILENYQQQDGSVIIPEILRGYMSNKESIDAKHVE